MAANVCKLSGQLVKTAQKSARSTRFVDSVRVKFQGGRGGDGCISMLHEFANEFGGPDGGNGGCGGHVVLRANGIVKSLNKIASAYKGLPGVAGMGRDMHGKNAEHTFVDVPIGTLVAPAIPKEVNPADFDPDKSPIVAELSEEGSMFIAARGGAGGKGNAFFLSNRNRHPRIAQAGAEGEVKVFELRMKLYAHVGLIGLPNAGKSTLLRNMTHANVQVGDYQFTTLYPQVGTLAYDDYTQIAISDLPGLIEDSHKNRGLGVTFLRHVKRCVCLLYVIDLSEEPIRQFETLCFELESYKKGLSERPHLVLANKVDLPEAAANLAQFAHHLAKVRPNSKLLPISTLRGDNLEELRLELKRMHDEYQAANADSIDAPLVW